MSAIQINNNYLSASLLMVLDPVEQQMFLAIATGPFQNQRSILLWTFMLCIDELVYLQELLIQHLFFIRIVILHIHLVWFVILSEHFRCAIAYSMKYTRCSWNSCPSSMAAPSFLIYLYPIVLLFSSPFIKVYPNFFKNTQFEILIFIV